MITLVGQEILRGRHIIVGGVTPRDWLHFIISLLEGATDASMAPYHISRSKLFIRERFTKALVDLDIVATETNIEHTRFPVPEDEQHESTDDFPGLVLAADLIGQLADINYLRKQPALFKTSFARPE